MENYLQYDAIHDFLVWLKTNSNPADINRFRSHTGKIFHGFEYFYKNKQTKKQSRMLSADTKY